MRKEGAARAGGEDEVEASRDEEEGEAARTGAEDQGEATAEDEEEGITAHTANMRKRAPPEMRKRGRHCARRGDDEAGQIKTRARARLRAPETRARPHAPEPRTRATPAAKGEDKGAACAPGI
jgi:hypothetical protein